ncbi:MAG: DegT/DnrJ/EryC1/StrS family aminotransferase [Bacteroidales bacterium]|nr:DegT/DnrJ/EryC1/StrS family aminotransferase [Bacteroidales bacterium]
MKTFVTRTSLPPFEEYCEQIRPLWESHMLTNMGQQHAEFTASLEQMLGCRVTLFSHGHLALEAVLRSLDLRPGCQIVTSPFTFVSTVHAIVRLGFEPVFCDVLECDGTMDPAALERLMGHDVGAILPVHVYGNVCDVDAIGDIARRWHVPVVYDAAHAFGVNYRGKSVVQYGDASVLSFHATKVFSTVEGGAVCCGEGPMVQALKDERNFGIRDEQVCAAPGGNGKMNELQAAMGICNLRHFPEALAKRRALAELYMTRLDGSVSFFTQRDGADGNCSYMPVLLESARRRDALADALDREGIHARKYFWPLACDALCYKQLPADVPVARNLSERVLALPLYEELKEEEVERICRVVLAL